MKVNSTQPQIINISPSEFDALPEKPLLIDVRFASEYKTEQGFTEVYNITGGMREWNKLFKTHNFRNLN